MWLGSWRQTSHPNCNNHRGRRDPPNHRQGQYNTTRDRWIFPEQERHQSHSHLQPTHRMQQIHHFPTNTGDQPYMTQNLAYNTMQHCQAPTQDQFQNPLVPQQCSGPMVDLCTKSPNSVKLQTPWHEKSISIPYPYTRNCNSKHNAHKSDCKSKLVYAKSTNLMIWTKI